ncbi:MAG: DNA methyltransferase [Rickettsiales bacterium]|nr:DNA methyltransferase [Rickettsiales bacterium]|tara:strand:+ start:1393 stop:2451 length:1059 start_codon:yes stop_codon:yes gene_type:complete
MFPSTRYQGSKRKLIPWLFDCMEGLEFDQVLDLFGGTASISYAFKQRGKQVHYNDYLRFNQQVGTALISNHSTRVSEATLSRVMLAAERGAEPGTANPGFITSTFPGIYFTEPENRWLDAVIPAVADTTNPFERAILWAALGQAALIKRPYNLFHRANLTMRLRKVQRSFGNKVAWERPFDHYLSHFVAEFNAAVFDSGRICQSTCVDAAEFEPSCDLVYLDPPYTSAARNSVDYRDFYHFLEGMLDYQNWSDQLDHKRRHKPLRRRANPWSRAAEVTYAFQTLFERCAQVPILALSYRSDGLPKVSELCHMLRSFGRAVTVHEAKDYRYALSGRRAGEVLLLAQLSSAGRR